MSWIQLALADDYEPVPSRTYAAVAALSRRLTRGDLGGILCATGWDNVTIWQQGEALPTDWPDKRAGCAGGETRLVFVLARRRGPRTRLCSWTSLEVRHPGAPVEILSARILTMFFDTDPIPRPAWPCGSVSHPAVAGALRRLF